MNDLFELNKEAFDYMSLFNDIKKPIISRLSSFFEPSVVKRIPHNQLILLVNAIKKDVENKTFYRAVDYNSVMSVEQLNSDTHRIFLDIIKKHFGKSAFKLLKQRKNINIFNISEVHVLHQEIFDDFGEEFVNRILNNDLTPQSLTIIKDVLTDKEKKADFKYFFDFYKDNIGFSQVSFERMIREYNSYERLVHNLRVSKTKLSSEQKKTMIDMFSDITNEYMAESIDDINNYYDVKNKLYDVRKKTIISMMDDVLPEKFKESLASNLFKNFFGLNYEKKAGYKISSNNALDIPKFFDVKEVLDSNSKQFNEEEKEMLKDLINIIDLVATNRIGSIQTMLDYCEKYEKKGNKTSRITRGVLNKLSGFFAKEMVDSLSKIESLEERAKSSEKGIYKDNDAKTNDGVKVNRPVYVLDGADFSFLSHTTSAQGLSGNFMSEDAATSWFEYENGTTHISCSYADQDNLSCMELQQEVLDDDGIYVTYLFDNADIFTMGATDIFTPSDKRKSDVSSSHHTRFMKPSKIASDVSKHEYYSYDEVAISRYNYDGEIRYGGKVIPSAILCSGVIKKKHIETAESFEKYCIENGLKPEGWKMPIVVVKKNTYDEISKMKAKNLISKNSEYFIHKEKIKEESSLKKEENLKKVVEKQSSVR